jgi:hypothetical protein
MERMGEWEHSIVQATAALWEGCLKWHGIFVCRDVPCRTRHGRGMQAAGQMASPLHLLPILQLRPLAAELQHRHLSFLQAGTRPLVQAAGVPAGQYRAAQHSDSKNRQPEVSGRQAQVPLLQHCAAGPHLSEANCVRLGTNGSCQGEWHDALAVGAQGFEEVFGGQLVVLLVGCRGLRGSTRWQTWKVNQAGHANIHAHKILHDSRQRGNDRGIVASRYAALQRSSSTAAPRTASRQPPPPPTHPTCTATGMRASSSRNACRRR